MVLNPVGYKDLNDVKGYSLFIDPKGVMYKVRNDNDPSDLMGHPEWADIFMTTFTATNLYPDFQDYKRKYPNIKKGIGIRFLTEKKNWIFYSRELNSAFISPIYSAKKPIKFTLSKEQVERFEELLELNKDPISEILYEYINTLMENIEIESMTNEKIEDYNKFIKIIQNFQPKETYRIELIETENRKTI